MREASAQKLSDQEKRIMFEERAEALRLEGIGREPSEKTMLGKQSLTEEER